MLDVREREAFRAKHVPSARNVPRGELELRANQELPDPTARLLVYCQFGKISTLAAQTLRVLGYTRAVALDGGFEPWTQSGIPSRETRSSRSRRRTDRRERRHARADSSLEVRDELQLPHLAHGILREPGATQLSALEAGSFFDDIQK